MTWLSHLRRLVLIALFSAGLALGGGGAWAQNGADGPDYAAWAALADRVERVLETGRVADSVLDGLRSEVAVFRDRFTASQNDNTARIATVQGQIAALGPRPEDGSERPEIAERRQELEERLARLLVPVRLAEEAQSRASGIISEIDRVQRNRQTEELLELGPSPLNPLHWPETAQGLLRSLALSEQELRENLQAPDRLSELRGNLTGIVLAIAVALLLLIKGPGLVRRGVAALRRKVRRGGGLAGYFASLGLILLPLAGIVLISAALTSSGLLGPRWELLVATVPEWAVTLLGIRWLAEQCFSDDDDTALVQLQLGRRRRARAIANILALVAVADGMVKALTGLDAFSPAMQAVTSFPVLAITAVFLFQLGRLARMTPAAAADTPADSAAGGADGTDAEAAGFRLRMAALLGKAVMLASAAGLLAGAIGYMQLAERLVFGMTETLVTVGLVLFLYRLVEELFFVVTGRTAAEANSLWPVLAGWVLALGALPVVALIWGARAADLIELWGRFLEGFAIGTTRISPANFLTFAIIFVLGYMITRLIQGALRSSVLPKTSLDSGGRTAVVSGVGYIGIFLAAMIAITTAGIDLSGLAIVAGALSVGIGFGLQTIVSNFVSGIILLIERPIAEGDWIEVGGHQGYVRAISVRSTRIETFDRTDVIVPNADLVASTVTNYTRGNTVGRAVISVGVAYGTDTRKVERLLAEVAETHPIVMLSPPPTVLFMGFGADSLDFQIRCILRDVNWVMKVKSEIHHEIARRFAEEGIEIPFAQRDLWIRNPEALRGAPPATPAPQTGTETAPTTDTETATETEKPDTAPRRPEPEAPNAPDAPEAPDTGPAGHQPPGAAST